MKQFALIIKTQITKAAITDDRAMLPVFTGFVMVDKIVIVYQRFCCMDTTMQGRSSTISLLVQRPHRSPWSQGLVWKNQRFKYSATGRAIKANNWSGVFNPVLW